MHGVTMKLRINVLLFMDKWVINNNIEYKNMGTI